MRKRRDISVVVHVAYKYQRTAQLEIPVLLTFAVLDVRLAVDMRVNCILMLIFAIFLFMVVRCSYSIDRRPLCFTTLCLTTGVFETVPHDVA